MRTFKTKALARFINRSLMLGGAYVFPGIVVSLAAPVIVTDGQGVTLVSGQTYDKLATSNTGSSITGSQVNIFTKGDHLEHSVSAQFGSRIALADSFIQSDGNAVDGVDAYLASVELNNVRIETSGDTAFGALIMEGARVDIHNGAIKTTGDNSTGLYIVEKGAIAESSGLSIETRGRNASGIKVKEAGKGTFHGGVINTFGESSRASALSVITP